MHQRWATAGADPSLYAGTSLLAGMKSFPEFLAEVAQNGLVNLVFEGGMYSLISELERLLGVFRKASIPYEIVGGVAVNAHILEAHRSRSFVTRDIDVLMTQDDLSALVSFAEGAGYQARKIMGGHALILPGQDLKEAVHILFAGKKPRSSYPVPNPAIRPEEKQIYGITLPVAPVEDLVIMKLNSLRDKDKVQLQILDQTSLITDNIYRCLPETLQSRLRQLRTQWEEEDLEL
jgi:hypothetical protein